MDSPKPSPPSKVRLQKVLADGGLGSRRACEALIAKGVVAVDGKPVTPPGTTIDPARQTVTVRGRRVQSQPRVYLLLNKPAGILCTSHDPGGRPTFKALLPKLPARVFTVGRLDRDSEGLILVTNDGPLAQRLSHPRHGIRKTYRVITDRVLTRDEAQRVLDGIRSRDETLRALKIRRMKTAARGAAYEVVLGEGRNRHIRRMFEALGIQVRRLQRVALGPLNLGRLESGACRPLNPRELERLKAYVMTKSSRHIGGR